MALVGREPAEAYARDRRARAEEALLPFRHLGCGRANVTVSARARRPASNPQSMNHRYFTKPAVLISDICVSDTSILRYSDTLYTTTMSFFKFTYHHIAVSVSPYPYRVSVIHSPQSTNKKKKSRQFQRRRDVCCAGGDGGGGRRRRGGGAAAVRARVRRTEPRARLGVLPLVPEVRFFFEFFQKNEMVYLASGS